MLKPLISVKLFTRTTACAVLLLGCFAYGQTSSGASAPSDEHEQMLGLLREIRERTPIENHYLGDNGYARGKEALAALPSDAPKVQRFQLLCFLGIHALRLGETSNAIDHFLDAYRLLPGVRAGIPREFANEAVLQLAMAYLRQGENENCVEDHNADRCILPIRGGGIHTKQMGARKAIEYLTILAKENPNYAAARWLLNLAYMTVGEYPAKVPKAYLIPPARFESEEKFPRFVDVAPNLGLNTLSMCGGAIVDDFDNDGFLDIVVSGWGTSEQMRTFRNNGDGTFSERTEAAGLTGLFGGLNMVQADYDNDGDLDVLVLRGAWLERAGRHPNSLLRNDGEGRFRDVTFEAGLGRVHYPTQTAAWADYDNDGDLDVYIGNENFPSQLFRNNGDGTFTDIAARGGVTNDSYAKGVVWGDYNNDRFPDLYVSNITGPNRLYRNNRDGTFTDVAPKLNVAAPRKSFPVWFWDFNNDGALDLYVSSYDPGVSHVAAEYLAAPLAAERNRLYQGDGEGGFREVHTDQNLDRISQPMGSNFGDVDNDGYPDFYLGTGYPAYEGLMPNLFFHNRRGKGFADVTTASGLGHLQKGHAVSFADLDNDGDQDIFAELGGSFPGDAFTNALFENPGFDNHWITIRLVGKKTNWFGIGARIRAEIEEDGEKRSVYQWVNSGGSFGANPLRQQIGAGKATKIDLLEVYWPTSDSTQQLRDVGVDQFIEITEGEPSYRQLAWKTTRFQSAASSQHHGGDHGATPGNQPKH